MLQRPPIAELPIFLFVLFMLSVIQGLKQKKKKKNALFLWQFMPLGLKFNWSKLKESRELMSFKNNFYPLTSFSQFSPYWLFLKIYIFLIFFEFTHCNSHSVVLFTFWLLFQMHTCNHHHLVSITPTPTPLANIIGQGGGMDPEYLFFSFLKKTYSQKSCVA